MAGVPGGFLITFGAAFGYAAGWNPYASDYTRYLPPDTNRRATGLWAALGVFLSCVALEIVGAAAATITDIGKYADNPTAGFTSHLTTVARRHHAAGHRARRGLRQRAEHVLRLDVVPGPGHQDPLRRCAGPSWRVVFGVAGFFLALSGLHDAGTKYNNFLLIIAYWIGPWLGVFFADQFLRRGKRVDGFLFDRKHNPWGGFAAMAIAIAVSIYFFANQAEYVGLVPKHYPAFGDITFEVGFVLAAAALRAVLPLPERTGTKEETDGSSRTPAAAGGAPTSRCTAGT